MYPTPPPQAKLSGAALGIEYFWMMSMTRVVVAPLKGLTILNIRFELR